MAETNETVSGSARRRMASQVARKRRDSRIRRHARLRKKISGTPVRPRLAVNRSSRHITVQLIDDLAGHTLAFVSSLDAEVRGVEGDKKAKAAKVGELIAARAKEVPAAIAKGVEEAKKNFFRVPRIGGTIVHRVQGEAAAGVVMLRPASPGTGVIAGGPVRAVLECAGISDILSKSLGSDNAINIVHATVAALKSVQRPEEVAARRGLPLEDVAPASMMRQRAEADAAKV